MSPYLFKSLQWHNEYWSAVWKYHDPERLPQGDPYHRSSLQPVSLYCFVSGHQTWKIQYFCESFVQLWSFVNGRHGQRLQGISCNINKPKITLNSFYMPFLFKPVKCMDTIHIISLYEPMMWVMCPLYFSANKALLYPSNIVGILKRLVFLRGGVFLNHHHNFIFALISRMIYVICFKMDDCVLTPLTSCRSLFPSMAKISFWTS